MNKNKIKNNHTLEANNLVTGYDKKIILDGVSISIPKNKVSVIIGANACGKSTLLKTLVRLIKPKSGEILIDGKKVTSIASKELAKTLGLLPQSPVVPEGITVLDLVTRGRFPYQNFMKGLTKDDMNAVENALELMNITELRDRCVDELSGGQRQRVWIAMALAQDTDILFLDEPTTYLDLQYQVEILDLLTDLNKKKGTTIVMVLHELNLTARYADYVFAVKNGNIISEGSPNDIVTPNLIKEVFNLNCDVIQDPVSATPLIVPIGRHKVVAKA